MSDAGLGLVLLYRMRALAQLDVKGDASAITYLTFSPRARMLYFFLTVHVFYY